MARDQQGQEREQEHPTPKRSRKRAESALELKAVKPRVSEGALERVVQELEIHCEELELQNEELRRAQAELTESHERYKDLFDLAPVGYLTLDRRGLILESNLTLGNLLQVDRTQLVGQAFSSFMEEQVADTFHRTRTGAFETGVRQSCELVLKRRAAEPAPGLTAHFSCLATTHQAEASRELRAAVVDVSSLRAAEAGQRAAESRTSALVDVASDAVVGSDASGRIESFNKAAERLFGYTRQEVIGKNVRILMPSPYREQHDLYMLRYVATGEPRIIGKANREVTGVHKNGTTFPLELGIGEWWDRGQRKFIAVLHDVSERESSETERAQLQEQLSHAQKLEAVGTLASGIAHDFINLLMGISGCASIALDALPARSPGRPYLNQIKKSADGGAGISRRLLMFSRKRSVDCTVFDLNRVIADMQAMLRRLLGEDIHLRLRLEALNSRIRSDPGQMEQVLINLAVNARDAMPRGGMLLFETAERSAPAADDDVSDAAADGGAAAHAGYVVLRITDNGVGMSEATRQRVFDPFFTTKEPGRGTGLGLSTVHGIVQEAGGHISVRSELGVGTTFELCLPKSDLPLSSDSVIPPPAPQQAKRGAATVLLVEDEATVRMGIRHYLEQGGYKVVEAASGPTAMEFATTHPGSLDLVLTDVVLPQLGGADIAREVQKLRPGIGVLYMSAHPLGWLESKGLLPARARVLQKPFGPEALLARVQRELSRRQTPTPSAPDLWRARRGSLLLVENERAARMALAEHFAEIGWKVLEAADGRLAIELCRQHAPEIVALLIDCGLPMLKGDQVAREALSLCPNAVLAYMCGYPRLDLDPPGTLLVKPLDLDETAATLDRLLQR